jgi:hypothetical protein
LAPEIILMIKIQPPITRMCDESPWRCTKQKWFENLPEIIPMLNSHFLKSNYVVCLYLQLFVGGLMSYLHYLWSFMNSGVQHILCCVFALFFFVLCTLCSQFLWIALFDWPFGIV